MKVRKNTVEFLRNHNEKFEREIKNINEKIEKDKKAGNKYLDIAIKTSITDKEKNGITALRYYVYVAETGPEIEIIRQRLIYYYTTIKKMKITDLDRLFDTLRIYYGDENENQKMYLNLFEEVSDIANENMKKDKKELFNEIDKINEKIRKAAKAGDIDFTISIFVPEQGVGYGCTVGCYNYYMYFVNNESSINMVRKHLYDYYTDIHKFDVDINEDNKRGKVVIHFNKKEKEENLNKESNDMGKLLDDVVKISKGETTVESVNYTAKIDEFIKSVAKDFKSIEVMVLIEGESVSASDIEENTICIVAAKDQRAELCGDLWAYYEKEEFDVEFDGCGILNISWEEHIKEDKDNE